MSVGREGSRETGKSRTGICVRFVCRSRHRAVGVIIVLALICMGAATLCGEGLPVGAVESVIEDMPVPEGSILDHDTYYRNDEGVEMASYSHAALSGEELLQFFDACMPQWGWEESSRFDQHLLQRAYMKDGVPVLIGVDKRKGGSSFNILKGVTGDWGYMAPLRPDMQQKER
jgi:hypothetical protein